jgi:hypothetical protein
MPVDFSDFKAFGLREYLDRGQYHMGGCRKICSYDFQDFCNPDYDAFKFHCDENHHRKDISFMMKLS